MRPAPRRGWLCAAAAVAALGLSACRPAPPLPARAEEAAERAVAYFAQRQGRVPKGVLFALDFARRKFGVARLAPVVADWKEWHNDYDLDLVRPLSRWMDPAASYFPGSRGNFRSEAERALFDGLFCARLASRPQYLRDLERLTAQSGYALTHAALSSELSRENGCFDSAQLAPLRAQMVKGLAALVAQRQQNLDLELEALAMLHYLGERAAVRREWVEAALALQHQDGGWGVERSDAASAEHPTALGLWVALEVARPGAPRLAWIPAPPVQQQPPPEK